MTYGRSHRQTPVIDLVTPVYIVRAGEFGADLAPRFWFSAVTLILIVWDVWRNRRLDYLWIFLIGLFIWTAVEALLQSADVRNIGAQSLFGVTLPAALAVLLQGSAEGASVAVLGIFLGDRLAMQETRVKAIILLAALCLFLVVRAFVFEAADPQGELVVTSRRNLTATAPFAVVSLAILFFLFSVFRPQHRWRMAAMAVAIFVVAGVWTAAQCQLGTRWIEVADNGPSGYVRVTEAVTAAALSFDVLVEIVMAYAAFYMIAALAGIVSPIPLPGKGKGFEKGSEACIS